MGIFKNNIFDSKNAITVIDTYRILLEQFKNDRNDKESVSNFIYTDRKGFLKAKPIQELLDMLSLNFKLNNLTTNEQFLVTGLTGTDFNIVSTGNTHTFNIPSASSTTRGLLTTVDWATFNNKIGAVTNGLTLTGTTVELGGNLTKDTTIGTGVFSISFNSTQYNFDSALGKPMRFNGSGTTAVWHGLNTGAYDSQRYNIQNTTGVNFTNSSGTTSLFVDNSNLRVGVGTVSPSSKFHVRETYTVGAVALLTDFGYGPAFRVFAGATTDFCTVEAGNIIQLNRNGAGPASIKALSDRLDIGGLNLGIAILPRSSGAPSQIIFGGDYGKGMASIGPANGAFSSFAIKNHVPGQMVRLVVEAGVVGISDTGSPAYHPSSILSLDSITRGFLPPRMTTAQRTAIVNPATGLIVYDATTNNLYIYKSTGWAIII